MKANELRIGNYAKHFENGIVLTLGRTIAFKTPPNTIRVDVDDLQPIPLTEEIILDFGYKQNSFSLNFENDTRISIYKENNCFIAQIDNTVIREIKYAHEWQNLYFDFTNEELTLIK